MPDQWFYSKNGQRFGPVDSSSLQQLASTGQIGVADLVWKNGMPEWLPASRVKGLFPQRVLAASPPPLPASAVVVDTTTQASLNNFSVVRLLAFPFRLLACLVGFLALPIVIKIANPSFDAPSADPILRVVLIIIGVGLSAGVWRTTGTLLDRICEPR